MSECSFERTEGHRLIKKTPTQLFFGEFCKILKNIYFEERLTVNGCLLMFYENKPTAPKRSEKITAELFVSCGFVVHQRNLWFPAASNFHVIGVDQSNFKPYAIEL